MHNVHNYLIVNLAVGDLLAGIVAAPFKFQVLYHLFCGNLQSG